MLSSSEKYELKKKFRHLEAEICKTETALDSKADLVDGVVPTSQLPITQDIIDALNNANAPTGINYFTTLADLSSIIPGTLINVAPNYSALPAANTVSGEFYWVENSQGTSWLPGPLGGTYYPNGLYYSNGTTWIFTDVPFNATQVEVDAGLNNNKFVTPQTFANASKWGTKQDTVTLTTTGTSGAATLTGATLNIPQYQSQLTFDNTPTNGSTNPITSDGVYDALQLKQDTVSLTTTGTSGAATLVGSTLNIPQYQGVLTNPVTGTGTAGQVAYFSGTSAVTGSSSLVWDNTNQRLDIIGKDALNATNSFIIKDNANRNLFYVKNDGEVGNAVTGPTQLQWRFGTSATSPGFALIRQSTTTILSSGNSGNAFVGTESNQPFGIISNNTARIFVEAAGNVGIGLTSSISARLHVRGLGTTSATTALLVQNSTPSELFKVLDNGDANFGTGMYWDNTNGRLGIGTASPTSKLHIVDTLTTTADLYTPINIAGTITSRNTAGDTIYGLRSNQNLVATATNQKIIGADFNFGTTFFDATTDFIGLKVSGFAFTQNTNTAFWAVQKSTAGDNGIVIQPNTNRWVIGRSQGQTTTISGARVVYSTDGIYISNNSITPTAMLHVRGSGTTSATTALLVQNSTPSELFKVLDNGAWNFNGDGVVKGSGNTSGTTALTVQNSATTELLKIDNSGQATFSNRVVVNRIQPLLSTDSVDVVGGIGTATGGNGMYLGQWTNAVNTSGTYVKTTSGGTFAPTSGIGQYINFIINNVINQTGGANGITRGLYVNPTLTAAADWRSVEFSNNTGWGIYGAGTANNYLAGGLGIGTATLNNSSLRINRAVTGGTIVSSISNASTINSDVTSNAWMYVSGPSTQAATFNLGELVHFNAFNLTIGTNSTISNQTGFSVSANIIGATNNYGFRGQIASGTGRWNIYMDGTAANYLAGNTSIGTTTESARLLVRGSGTTSATTALLVQNSTPSELFKVTDDGFITHAGNITASSAIARAKLISTTLTASANNDTLVALDIAPTFTAGAFTGVTNYGIRSSSADALIRNFVISSGQINYQGTNTQIIGFSNQFFIINSGASGFIQLQAQGASGNIRFASGGTTEHSRILANGNWGIGTTASTAKMHIVGSGTTSATTALLVQNSTPSELFKVLDNGAWNFNGDGIVKGSTSDSLGSSLTIRNSSNTKILEARNDAELFLGASNWLVVGSSQRYLYRSINTTGIFSLANDGTVGSVINLYGSTHSTKPNTIDVRASFAPTSGSVLFANWEIISTINQTGGANGITRGLYVNPTLTAAADWRSIETSNNTGYAAYFAGSADLFLGNGTDIQIGTTTGTKIGTATTEKLSFWGAAPDVQPTTAITAASFSAGTSGIIDDSATFGGYTIGQIVAAMKRAGLLA